MLVCRYCGKDQGGISGIFEARDRGEEIERVIGPEMGACDCEENPYVAVFAPGERVGKMVLKSSLLPKPEVADTEWNVL